MAPPLAWTFRHDLDAAFSALANLWPRIQGSRLFVTGGTGFIGRWMLETLRDADVRLGLGVEAVILTRDPAAFADRAPHLAAYPGFRFVAGNVRDFDPPGGEFTHVIHAATDASAHLNAHDPRLMFDTIVDGTRRTLDLAAAQPCARYFFLSSGAVYGAQPSELTHVPESWRGGPDCLDPRSAYGEGKRAAEMMCAIYGRQFGLDVVTARIFALLGPIQSLDVHFAAGNFIRDALQGRTIRVEGAGNAVRSYLYAADLAVWLWTLMLNGGTGAVYNVGSEEAVSIAELAKRVSAVLGGGPVEVLGRPDPGWNPGRYVPSTAAIRSDLELQATVGLDEAIRRTAMWNGWMK